MPTKAAIGARSDALSVRDYAALRARGEDHVLLDVREPFERAIATLEGSVHIPLGVLPLRMHELDRTRPIVLHCHHGARSQRALELLRAQGFGRLRNLTGGIDAWSRDVDPATPRY